MYSGLTAMPSAVCLVSSAAGSLPPSSLAARFVQRAGRLHRLLAARMCRMRPPLGKASDCTLHRHLVQLTVSRALLAREADTVLKLQNIGISGDIGGALLYVDDENTELFPLDTWWTEREARVLSVLKF